MNGVNAIKTQASNIIEVLFQLDEQDTDPKIKSEAESLAHHGTWNFEFLLAMTI